MILQSRTGNGKTIAYLLPLINRFFDPNTIGFTRVVVIVPTRELAIQVSTVAKNLMINMNGQVVTLCGPPKAEIDTHSQLIVATPGALINSFTTNQNMHEVNAIVLDEFDRLFDFGFVSQIEKILGQFRQKNFPLFLISATIPKDIEIVANRILRPGFVRIVSDDVKAMPCKLKSRIVEYEPRQFFSYLVQILNNRKDQKGIVIFPTTRSMLFYYTIAKDVLSTTPLACLHGRMCHEKRVSVYENFSSQNQTDGILFTTDVFARGIDIKDLQYVVQVGVSGVENAVEQFIHRSGRTARAGRNGESILMVGKGLDDSSNVVRHIRKSIPIDDCPIEDIPLTSPTSRTGTPYQKHLSTKCLESLLSLHFERLSRSLDRESRISLAKHIIDMVRSTGLPQPHVSKKLSAKLKLDSIPGLLTRNS
jgi:superfamily II DNA/RNA helicase